MGSGPTKILSFDDASKRFSQADLDRIESTLRDISNGTNELNYQNFKRDVFLNFLPEKLSQRLFHIYTGSSRNALSYKELICILGIINHGLQRERMQLLYAIFSQTDTLRWHDIEEFLSQCGDQLPDELENMFQNDEIVTQDKFLKWLQQHKGHTTKIIDWLMNEQRSLELQSTTIDRISNQYSILAGVTHLSEKEIRELEQCYCHLYTWGNNSKQQQITSDIFANTVSSVLPSMLISGVFEAFDENRDGFIDLKEFVCAISAACRGPQYERYKFLFRVFDRDHDGALNRADVIYMCACLIELSQYIYVSNITINTSPEIYADKILNENETILKLEDFLTWCQKDNLIIELVDLIYQTCHVVLGLRPLSQQAEHNIVKQYLRREKSPFVETNQTYIRSSTKAGSSWFLISMDWWTRWEATCSSPTMNNNELINKKSSLHKPNKTDNNRSEPGDINNSPLIEKVISNDCVQLKPNLRQGIHFEIVPELLWIFICKYYRLSGPVVRRKIIYRKKQNKPELDFYPLIIKIYRNQIFSPQQMQALANSNTTGNNSNSMQFVYPLLNLVSASMFGSNNSSTSMTSSTPRHYIACSYFVSPHQTIRSLAEELSNKFSKSLDEMRLWMRYNENDLRQIDFDSIDEITCQEAGFNQNGEILLELRNNDLTWPEELYTLATRSKSLISSATNSTGNVEEEGRGLIGLSNLGNTCFLNAAVQCMSHTFPLTFYFLHKYHFYEINKDNPIGMQGHIALRYGQLISKLWGNVRGPLAPFELRDSVAKFGSSRFTDFQQHDSQEFLSFLLDGLHEDLNRVHDKPYVELKDSDDRPDEDVAHEHWSNHVARNTSIVVDLFHGLLRSQVKCRICELKSVRFDPFNILSLPLPFDTSIYIEVKLIRLDGSRPVRYGIKLDGELTVDHIKKQLSILSTLSIEQLAFFDVPSPSVLRRYTLMDFSQTKIKQLTVRDFIAYELPLSKSCDIDTTQSTYIVGIHRRMERQERYLSPLNRQKILFFGQPILIPYDKNDSSKVTNKSIYEYISKQLQRLLRKNTDMTYRSNHALDCDDSLGQRYPFQLKHVYEDGKRCSICPWNRFCLGCSFESNDQDFSYTNGSIVIEWESSVYYLRYLSGREQDVEIHSSVKNSRTGNINETNFDEITSTITLEDCLQSFINWENLDSKEMFNCKRCKQLQPADKKLDIWKLPPCLIFHIKRFQFSNNRWIKSSRPIRFPIRSFYPSKYLAQCSMCSNSLTNTPNEDNLSVSSSSVSLSSLSTMPEITSTSSTDNNLILSPARLINDNSVPLQKTQTNMCLPPPETLNQMSKKKKRQFGRRKKDNDTQNDKQSIVYPPQFNELNERNNYSADHSFDVDSTAYNLYAFICHYGGIGGGHYVSFVKNRLNQQWYCFNDSSCKPVSDNFLEQCSSSAYLLFYERESLDYRCYMPNVQGKIQVANELSLANDDRWCSIM